MFDDLASHLIAPGSLKTKKEELEGYSHDATEMKQMPGAVLLVESTDDLIAAVKFCRERQISITPRGAGTGLSGGCVPCENGLVISTERLTRLKILPEQMTAICEPGVITKTVQDEAERHGLTYPPDPASYEESTMGGNVAEGAGGLRCKRFGVTKDYILGIKAVTSRGELLETGWFAGNFGVPLTDLLTGSEGTLAIITDIALRLISRPGDGITMLIAFNSTEDAARTVTDITTSGLVPTVLEFLDGDAAACSNQYEENPGLDMAEAILLIETDDRTADKQSALIKKMAETHNCSFLRETTDPDDARKLWNVRRNLSRAVKEIAAFRISEDVVVPNSKFPLLVSFVKEMNRTSPLRINSFGHAGDGNLHVNFLSDENSTEQRELMEKDIERLLRKTLELGGTLTGEHGIGLAKRQYMTLEHDSATMDYMRAIRDLFDPEKILNPDKIFS